MKYYVQTHDLAEPEEVTRDEALHYIKKAFYKAEERLYFSSRENKVRTPIVWVWREEL